MQDKYNPEHINMPWNLIINLYNLRGDIRTEQSKINITPCDPQFHISGCKVMEWNALPYRKVYIFTSFQITFIVIGWTRMPSWLLRLMWGIRCLVILSDIFFLYFVELVSRAKDFLSSCERFHVLIKLMKISPISLHMIIRCYVLIMYSPKCAHVCAFNVMRSGI